MSNAGFRGLGAFVIVSLISFLISAFLLFSWSLEIYFEVVEQGPRNLKSFKHTLKQLEEMSVSCRGVERIQLLRRWLVALKEIERLSLGSNDHNEKNPEERLTFDDSKDSPRKPTMVRSKPDFVFLKFYLSFKCVLLCMTMLCWFLAFAFFFFLFDLLFNNLCAMVNRFIMWTLTWLVNQGIFVMSFFRAKLLKA